MHYGHLIIWVHLCMIGNILDMYPDITTTFAIRATVQAAKSLATNIKDTHYNNSIPTIYPFNMCLKFYLCRIYKADNFCHFLSFSHQHSPFQKSCT